jgi:glycosyltransferase 2 family protein
VWRRIAVTVAKVGLGLGLLAWVISSHWHLFTPDGEDVGLAAALHRPVRAGLLAAAAAMTVSCLCMTVVRWYLLVRAQDLPFTLGEAFRLGLVSYAVSIFLPGSVGGDLFKAACIARGQERRTVAAATVVFDRLIGTVGLYSLAVGVGTVFWASGLLDELLPDPFPRELLISAIAVAAAFCSGFGALWLLLRRVPESWSAALSARLQRVPRLGTLLAELWRAVWQYRARGRAVAAAWLLSVINHATAALSVYLAAITLTPAADVPPVAAHYLIVPIGSTIQASFPAPGGIGGSEYGFGLLYAQFGFAFAAGVLAALVARALSWAVGVAAYLLYLRMRPSLPQPGDG